MGGIPGSQGTPVSEVWRRIPELSWADVNGTSGDREPTRMMRPQSQFVLHLMKLRPERRALGSRSVDEETEAQRQIQLAPQQAAGGDQVSQAQKRGPSWPQDGKGHPWLEHALNPPFRPLSGPRAPLSQAHGALVSGPLFRNVQGKLWTK